MTEYEKFLRDSTVENNILLGEYNSDEKYVISPEIKEQLVKLNKLITVYKQDYLLCETKIQDLSLKFIVKFTENKQEEQKYSSLYLIEQYKYANKKVKLETFLVKFKEFNDIGYLEKLKTALNLLTQEDLGEGKSIKNENKILEELILNKKTISKNLIIEMGVDNRKAINDLLKVLKSSARYDLFEKLFKERVKGLKLDKNTAKYYAALKKILDEIILEHYDEIEEETRKWLEQVNQSYVLLYMSKKKAVIKKISETSTSATTDKKPEKSKKKDAKKGGKSGGGKGKAKGKDKGKDKKNKKESGKVVSKTTKPIQTPPTTKTEKTTTLIDNNKIKNKKELFDQNFDQLMTNTKSDSFVKMEQFRTTVEQKPFIVKEVYTVETVTVTNQEVNITIDTKKIDEGREL